MKKFLIVGLGNIGPEYEGTRHNAGFYGRRRACGILRRHTAIGPLRRHVATVRVKNYELMVLKPSTFMNLPVSPSATG